MSGRRYVSTVMLLTAMVLLAGLTSPAAAQKEKAKKKDGLDETTAALMDVLKKSAKEKDYRKDPTHGGGKTPYEDTPSKPGLIIGFDLYPGLNKNIQYLRGARPVYLTADGKTTYGTVRGWTSGTGVVHEKAKPGYAVAGLKVHTEIGEIAGLMIVFAKITETGLDMSDTYESKYYGHKDPDTAAKVVMTGEPIVGIHGMIAENAKSHNFALGLIVMNKDRKKP